MDFAPDLGPVTRPQRTEWCPRCQAQTWPGCETCPACGVVLAKARVVQSSVIRPRAPVIVPARQPRAGLAVPLLLMGASVLGAVAYWYTHRPGPEVAAVEPGDVQAPAGVPIRAREPHYGAEPAAPQQGGWAAPSVPVQVAEPTAVPMPDTTPRDNNGHDEAWWRARCDAREARLAAARVAAENAVQIADAAANAAGASRLAQAAGAATVGELQARAEIARQAVTAIEAEADAMAEECRRANCYPGWLR